jgi:hypothetical protein
MLKPDSEIGVVVLELTPPYLEPSIANASKAAGTG